MYLKGKCLICTFLTHMKIEYSKMEKKSWIHKKKYQKYQKKEKEKKKSGKKRKNRKKSKQ